MAYHNKMQRSIMSLFLGLSIHFGQYLVIEMKQPYPCDLKIVEGVRMRNPDVECEGWFPCDVYVDGRFPHSLTCSYNAPGDWFMSPFYMCKGVCPHGNDSFESVCREGGRGWTVDIDDLCLNKALIKDKRPSTTSPSSPIKDGDGYSIPTSTVWFAIMAVLLILVMICICGVAMRTARQRRRREQQMYRNRAGSPTMIYSVTLDCGPGQALSQSINDYMRRTSQQRERDLDRDLDRDPDTLICPTVVVKPPSYNEAIRADNDKDIPNPNPPPYSEK